jgi:hypothetical protein
MDDVLSRLGVIEKDVSATKAEVGAWWVPPLPSLAWHLPSRSSYIKRRWAGEPIRPRSGKLSRALMGTNSVPTYRRASCVDA